MSKPKFTKGPWKANFDDYTKSVIDILNENKTVIAMVPDQEVHQGDRTILSLEEIEANVHLITAAPDMYEALRKISLQLEEMRPMLSDTHAYMRNEMIADIKILLRKARGKGERPTLNWLQEARSG